MSEINSTEIPPNLQWLLEIMTPQQIYLFCQQFKYKTNLYISTKPSEYTIELLGIEKAEKLAKLFGGVQLCMTPRFKQYHLRLTREAIRDGLDRGQSRQELCQSLNLCPRTLANHIKAISAKDSQDCKFRKKSCHSN
jgi:hypothetical protein